AQNSNLWENPTALFTNPQSLISNPQSLIPNSQLAFSLGMSLFALGLAALLINYQRSQKLYAAVAVAMILSVVVTPLLQSNQVAAFYGRQESKQLEREQLATQRENQEQLLTDVSGRSFDPHQKPSLDRSTDQVLKAADLPLAGACLAAVSSSSQSSSTTDTCDSDTDTDNDGLSDNVECYETGTWVDDADTDDDGIVDSVEVAGFEYAGMHWYLDPRNPDTNGDGLLDQIECPELVAGAAKECRDADQDGTPDVFDFDNDGDGVPDTRDALPDTYIGNLTTGLSDGQLNYDITLADTGHLVFVDFELRPTNSDHLWYAGNVLDWPSGDTQGQIQRQGGSTTAETFLDFDLETYGNSLTADHGDLQINPYLEIKISYDHNNPSGGLPIKSTLSSTSEITGYHNIDWLDTQTLAEYGISVTFDAVAGEALWVYVPLISLDDSTGDSPLALTGRMLYKPEVLAWGQKHQARLTWMINALVDTCDTSIETMPEEFTYNGETKKRTDDDAYESWCAMDSYDDNGDTINIWKTSQSIIHSYYDDFYVTGMSVREDHGIDLVMIAETDTNLAYERNLWHLANALQNTWMEGQLLDNGERLDVFGIDELYDDWGITDALYTEEIVLESQTNLGDVAQIHNTHVLNSAFPAPADGYNTTLLYAGEETYRSVGLADASPGSAANDLSLDFSNQPLGTMTFMRFAPFSYDAATDSWDGADYAAYVQSLGAGLVSVFDNTALDSLVKYESISDYDALRTGAVQLALSYYMSLYQGPSSLVEIDGKGVNTASLQSIIYTQDPAVAVAKIMLGDIQAFYDQLDLSVTAVNGDALLSTWNVLANSSTTLLQAIADADQGTVTNYNLAFAELFDYYKTYAFDSSDYLRTTPLANAMLGSTVSTAITTLQTVGFGLNTAQNLTVVGVFLKEAYNFYNLYYYYNEVKKLETPLENFTDLTRSRSYKSIFSLVLHIGLAVAPIVYALATGSIQITDLEFTAMLASAVARVYVLIVSFVMSANPVGALVLTILAIIDGIIMAVCAIVEATNGEDTIDPTVDAWVCGGIIKAVGKAITYLIFDQTPLVDLDKSGRLGIALNEPILSDPAAGIVVNNDLQVSAVVTSNLYFDEPTVIGYLYWHQFDDDNLNDSTFEYHLQSEEKDKSPSQNQVNWDTPPGREPDTVVDIPNDLRYYKVFNPSETFELASAGVNQALDIYFTEAFNMNAQECWVVYTPYPVPVCYLRDHKDSVHTDLSNEFVFDVFPDTIGGFMALASEDGGLNYRLGWDEGFPAQWDADGDGLISQAHSGDDPNDGNPDIDGDGLSDYYEYEHLSLASVTSPDTDCDGLTDYWEVFYHTDPLQADSDRDGLADGLEVFHSNVIYPYENSKHVAVINTCENKDEKKWSGGWEVVYDFDSDVRVALTSWVSADPADFDSDDDGITDNYEYIYGYNPNAISSLSVLSLQSGLPAGSNYLPGASVVYTATIENKLDNRYAQGLLQAEYPTDNLVSTNVMETLVPLASTTMQGSVDLDSDVSATTITTLTIRAGAVINDISTDRLVWLHLNEKAGSETFADDSLTGHDFVCATASCPNANGSYLKFAAGTTASDEGDVIFLDQNKEDLEIQNFTVGGWFKPTEPGVDDFVLFSYGIEFSLVKESPADDFLLPSVHFNGSIYGEADFIIEGANVPLGEWTHVMFALEPYYFGAVKIVPYINGQQQGTGPIDIIDFDYGPTAQPHLSPVGDVDEFEFYPEPLSADQVRALVTVPSLRLDFGSMSDISNQAHSVSKSDLPDVSGNQASFDQDDHLTITGQGLDLSAGKFAFSTWIRPVERWWNDYHKMGDIMGVNTAWDTYPVIADSDPGVYTDTWQHIAGNEVYVDSDDDGVYETIDARYPTLSHNNTGKIRIRFGEKNVQDTLAQDLCSFETAEGVLDFDKWQYLTVSYNGSQFFVYIDGQRVDNGGSADCTNQSPSSETLYVGNSSDQGYLWLHSLTSYYSSDWGSSLNAEELRIDVDGDILWSTNNNKTGDGNRYYTINAGYVLDGSEEHKFRLWEDDGGGSYTFNSGDDEYYSKRVRRYTRDSSFSDYQDGNSTGTIYWGVISYFFRGGLQDFRVYNYTLDDAEVADLYKTNYYALQLDFDEPPGEDIFSDSSGNDIPGECDSNAGICPDSGIPGRNNQSLRFDGADDYLTFGSTPEDLGLDNSSFTVMAWVKLDSLTGDQTILGSAELGWSDESNDMVFAVRNGQPYMRYGRTVSNAGVDVTSATTLNVDEWHHLAWVYEKESEDDYDITGTMSIYLNEEPVPIATLQATRQAREFAAPVVVGYHDDVRSTDPNSRYLDGMLDDLTIARKVLSPAEILTASLEAPVLNLHLDEDYASILMDGLFADETNNNNDAVCGPNCPQGGDKGQMREAAVFTATNSIIATDDDDLDLGEFSASLWVKPTQSMSQVQQLFSKQNGSDDDVNFDLSIPADSLQVRFSLQDASCNSTLGPLTTAGKLIEDQWNQVAATFDGSIMALYINGSQDISSTVASGASACTAGTQFILGDSGPFGNGGNGFKGSIDEVAVYGTALHKQTVSDIFDYQASWFDVVYPHTLVIDVDAPQIMTMNKHVKTFQDGGTVILAVNIVDATSPVTLVEYSVNKGAWTPADQESDGSAAWTIEFKPQSDGLHTIRYRAVDAPGNYSSIQSWSVKVDVTPPTIRRDYWVHYYLKSVPDSLTISGEAIDRGRGVVSGTISVELLDIMGHSVSGDLPAEATNNHWALQEADWTIDYPFPVPPYGIYSVQVSAEDRLQNRTDHYELVRAHLDSYGPVADVYAPSSVITGSSVIPNFSEFGLAGTASDLRDPIDDKLVDIHFDNWLAYGGERGTYVDGSGNFFNAKCTACPAIIRRNSSSASSYGTTAKFDGSVMTITLDAENIADSVLALENFSLGLWVKPTYANTVYQTLVRKDADGSLNERNFALGLLSDSTQPHLELQGACGDTGSAKTLTATTALPLDAWSHVMATYDDNDSKLALYVNGELDASATITPSGVCTATHDIVIGENLAAYVDELAIYNRALDAGEIYYLANPLETDIEEVNFRFRHASGSVWPSLDPDGIKLYLSMDNDPLADVSPFAQDVACVGNCPEQEIGRQAFAARFDGVDDVIQIKNFLDPATTDLNASAWFKLDDLSASQPILHQQVVSGTGVTWLGVNSTGKIYSNLGGSALEGDATVGAGTWHHAALSSDGDTLNLYLNGSLQVSATQSISPSTGDLLLGFDGAVYLSGALDEVFVYDRALSNTEIEIIATESPWLKTDLRYGRSQGTFVNWHYKDPIPQVEGPYAIDLWTSDNVGNASYIPNAWIGTIDQVYPLVNITITEVSDFVSRIECDATDFNLDDASFDCPATGDRSYGYQDAGW
ncbi:MAG: LamG domain-containing protein, partial [Chloroflexi bacterium]|nr:LamG domain-containing protein [Chloroflexota bacterium]